MEYKLNEIFLFSNNLSCSIIKKDKTNIESSSIICP